MCRLRSAPALIWRNRRSTRIVGMKMALTWSWNVRAVTFVAVIQVETATVNSNQVIRSYVFRRSTEGCHELNWLSIEIRTACSNNYNK